LVKQEQKTEWYFNKDLIENGAKASNYLEEDFSNAQSHQGIQCGNRMTTRRKMAQIWKTNVDLTKDDVE
jgi:hypothetical protein